MRLYKLLVSFCLLLQATALQQGFCAKPPITFNELKTRLTTLEVQQQLAEHYNPNASHVSGLLMGGDALYWQASESGLPYVIQNNNPANIILHPEQLLKFHVKELQFDWDFGARVHLGWQFHRDSWGLLCTWTHFNTKGLDTGFNNSSKWFSPIWADPDFTQRIDSVIQADATWHLFHNTLDLTLGRAFCVSRYLILKPEIGVSAASIDQHFNLHYKRTLLPGVSDVRLKNNFKGIGLLAGLDTRFCFGKGWSIFNITHFELYYGNFHVKRKEYFITETLSRIPINEEIKNRWKQICPALQMQMGLRWDHDLLNGKHALSIKLAYDYQLFFSQNQFLRILKNQPMRILENEGDLAIAGGTFSFLLTF